MYKKIILIFLFFYFAAIAQETEEYELRSINFSGNNVFSSSVLKDIIYSEESPGWFWKFLHSFTPLGKGKINFDSSFISTDLQALEDFYNANGYFKASFSYSYDIDTTDKTADLNYFIREGEPSIKRNHIYYGLDDVPPPVLYPMWDLIHIDTNQVYNQFVLQQKINSSLNHLWNNGYMFGKLDSTVIFKDTSVSRADLDIYFTTGNRYTIDTVIVETKGEGADEVEEDLLRDVTGIKAGEFYNLEKIRRGQVRLFRTGLFNSVLLSGVEQDTSGSLVPVKLEGSIGMMNELAPEIIMNNQQSAFNVGLGASYIRKNFLRDARRLTLSSSFGVQDIFNLDFSNLVRRFSFRDTTLLGFFDARAKIEQPYLFGRPIYGIWENYATINKQKNFNNTIYGSKLTFEFEMPRYTFINFLSAFYNVEVSNEVYRTNNDSLSRKLISAIGADFGSTTADNILFPTKGHNISFQLEEANLLPYLVSKASGKEYTGALFYKALVSTSFYFSLSRKDDAIFGLKTKVGHLQAYFGDYAGLPLNRTFYAGGSNSVRGWRANELVPFDAPRISGSPIRGINAKGGTFLFEGSAEYRYKLHENIGTALFADYGNTWLSYKQFRFDNIALAVGLGVRYYTPIAPFRLDFGFKFYDPSDKKLLFNKKFFSQMEIHFGIGEAF